MNYIVSTVAIGTALLFQVAWPRLGAPSYHAELRVAQVVRVTPSPVVGAPVQPTPTAAPRISPSPSLSPTPVATLTDRPVPFTIQAPEQRWDAAAEEYCEEASMLMAARYFEGVRGTLEPQGARTTLEQLASWEDERFGYNKDINAQEMAVVLTERFDLSVRLLTSPTKESVKKELRAGSLLIVPLAGKKLGNPNFKNGGPWYHVLVVRGFDGDEVITNDPGTRKGEGYRYSFETLLNANHDFTGDKERVEEGARVVIVVEG